MLTARVLARFVLAAVAAAPLRAAPAQAPADRSAAAYGLVTDQFGQPVADAELLVRVGTRTLATRTGEAGAYRLDSIPAAAQRLRVRRLGYLPLGVTLSLPAAGVVNRDVGLVRLPLSLAPNAVQEPDGELRGRFADFAARRAAGRGAFVDRAAIDRLGPAAVSDLMRSVAGFRLQAAGNGAVRLAHAGAAAGCAPRMYVDGVPYAPVDGLDDFDPEHVEALEAYGADEAPPTLGDGASPCGAVVVWLRR